MLLWVLVIPLVFLLLVMRRVGEVRGAAVRLGLHQAACVRGPIFNRLRLLCFDASVQGFRAVSQGVGVLGSKDYTDTLNAVTMSLSLALYPSFIL